MCLDTVFAGPSDNANALNYGEWEGQYTRIKNICMIDLE